MLGKVSGALLGFLIGMAFGHTGLSLLLAVLGAVLGHLTVDAESPERPQRLRPSPSDDELPRRPPTRASAVTRPLSRPRLSPNEELARALCPIFIEVARADGEVSQNQIRVVKKFFDETLQFPSDDLEGVRSALKEAITAPAADLEELMKKVRAQVKPGERLMAVTALYELALVEGSLSRAASDALKRVVNFFNLSEEQLREITALQLGNGQEQYAMLGLAAETSDEELKIAFRRLAAEHHPDRAAAQSPQEAEDAAQKFRQIKEAYDDLKKLRGL